MRVIFAKSSIVTILILALLGAGIWLVLKKSPELPPLPPEVSLDPRREIIGKSVEGREIEAFIYGKGETHLLFVGGIHGGYEWNSVLLAYQFMDYLEKNPEIIPNNLTIEVIPSANPDGVFKVIGKEGHFSLTDVPTTEQVSGNGRFNANEVDLNRNFDCNWKPESTWRSKTVSAGLKTFSEPETVAIRDFVSKTTPVAVIFWHSQSNAVYASACNSGILPVTLDLMNAYSEASGYTAIKTFDQYSITGDAEGWLASINVPAITVELKTHNTIEWEENLAGIKAIFGYYRK